MTGVEVRIIHLARATARRAIMERELAAAGLAATDWAGVDGRDPANASRLATLPDRGPWGEMGPHAKGCLLSHLDAFAALVAGDAEHALILEDDVFLSPDLGAWLADMSWWPAGADIVKIERWRDDRLALVLSADAGVHRSRSLPRLLSRHSGTGGYLISRAGAARVLAHPQRNLPVDHLLFNPGVSALARELRVHQCAPALVQQGNDPAPPAAATGPRSLPAAVRLSRGLAELRVLTLLPRLIAGRARLARITFAPVLPGTT